MTLFPVHSLQQSVAWILRTVTRRRYSLYQPQTSDHTAVCGKHQTPCAVGMGGLTVTPVKLQQTATAAMPAVTLLSRFPAAPRPCGSAARVQLPLWRGGACRTRLQTCSRIAGLSRTQPQMQRRTHRL